MGFYTPTIFEEPTIFGWKPIPPECAGSPSVRVCLLDGPIDLDHECFSGASLTQLISYRTHPACDHGTHVASILFGQPDSPVKGIVPLCDGVSLPIFSTSEPGITGVTQDQLADTILDAIEQECDVIVLSAGEQLHPECGLNPSPTMCRPTQRLTYAIERLEASEGLLVSAAGNGHGTCVHIPALIQSRSILRVGACTAQGVPWEGNCVGYQTPTLLAPGIQVPGAKCGGGLVRRTGTSFATPVIGGVVAFLLGLIRSEGFQATPSEVGFSLLENARSIKGFSEKLRVVDLSSFHDLRKVFAVQTIGEPHPTEPQPESPDNREHEKIEQPITPESQTVDAILVPSACSCGNKAASELPTGPVYVIGRLGHAFTSNSRRASMEYASGQILHLNHAIDLFRHLAGWTSSNPGGTIQRKPNRSDLASVIFTVRSNNRTKYALTPTGYRIDDQFDTLLKMYGEQEGAYSVGRETWLLDHDSKLCEEEDRPDYCAVPGFKTGRMVMLASGFSVPEISIDVGTIRNWNVDAILSRAGKTYKERISQELSPKQLASLRQTLSAATRLAVENEGFEPAERALNTAISTLETAAVVLSADFGELLTENSAKAVAFRGFDTPVPIHSDDPSRMLYEVKATFYNPLDLRQADLHYRWLIDVADPVPRQLRVADPAGFSS